MPPLRSDHVDSFLRPRYCPKRAQKANGEITAEPLREVKDKAITDGEFRRTCFHIDLGKR